MNFEIFMSRIFFEYSKRLYVFLLKILILKKIIFNEYFLNNIIDVKFFKVI